jgi:agmatine deiminase
MLGYRMPAEWEPHQSTWLTWPHCEETWPGKLEEVFPAYVAMIDALRVGEVVHVNTLDEEHRERVRQLLALEGIETGPGTHVQLHLLPTDDEWIRDYGALVVARRGGLAATDWIFNAWGEKYDRIQKNNLVPEAMAGLLNIPLFSLPIVLEGGSIDVNGRGTALTTESCLLNPNRNPALDRRDVEHWLLAGLGIRNVVWLGDGIAGDDTDGHVDDLSRFVASDTVVTVVEEDPTDDNYAPLRENLERLHRHVQPDGSRLRVVELPMPDPLHYNGERLPASHANFYIGNRAVLLPTFGGGSDDRARGILQELFPERTITGIPAADLVWGLGACHCLTQQVPALSEDEE